MSDDLISRSALLEKNQPVDFLFGHDEDAPYSGMAVAACDVEDAHAVDAVEVVRCKDCAVPHNKWTGCPNMNGLIPPPEHFCSYGERKDNETD